MARVRVDIRELRKFKENIDRLSDTDIEKMNERIIKETARRFLNEVIQRTPVGLYPEGSGRVGGTLRRGWTANQINVRKNGSNYEVEIINSVDYASFVEYGHRTRNGGWVNGRFFMTISVDRVEGMAPAIAQKHIRRTLRSAFNGN